MDAKFLIMKKLVNILVLLGLFVIWSCKDDIPTLIGESYVLEATPASHTFPSEGGEIELNIKATKKTQTILDGKVNLEEEDALYTVAVEGDGFKIQDNKIVAENSNEILLRTGTATVTIEGTDIQEKIILTQIGIGNISTTYTLEVSPETYAFPATGGTATLTITATRIITTTVRGEVVDVSESDAAYTVSVDNSDFTIIGNSITAVRNIKGEPLTGTVTVTLNDDPLSKTIEIKQDVGYSPNSYTIDGTSLTLWKGRETVIDLSSDPEFEHVTTIPNNAFNGTDVEVLTISKNVTTIGDRAFMTANSLIEFKVSEDNDFFETIGGVLFRRAGTAKTLWKFPRGRDGTDYIVPEGTTRIGQYAFEYNRLISIEFPEGVEYVDYRCFYLCSSLKSITLPSTIRSIGNQAFTGASAFTDFHVKSNTPPPIGGTAFATSNIANATLYVPIGARENYLAHTVWSQFKEIVEE